MDRDNPDDQKVKDFIDAATQAQLEQWFGLPSFDQAADAPPATSEDPDVVATRERRAAAIAAVDPALVEAHRRRVEVDEARLFYYKPDIVLTIEKPCGLLDQELLDRQASIAEPREVEISEELRDDLKDCTPQALLRDLHRPELDFEKTFEVVDMAAEQRLDAVAEVALAMTTSWKLPPLDASPFIEGRKLMAELRAARTQPLDQLLAQLPNRRVSE